MALQCLPPFITEQPYLFICFFNVLQYMNYCWAYRSCNPNIHFVSVITILNNIQKRSATFIFSNISLILGSITVEIILFNNADMTNYKQSITFFKGGGAETEQRPFYKVSINIRTQWLLLFQAECYLMSK